MRCVGIGLLSLLPVAGFAQEVWETWEADGKTIAGICDDAVDETCVVVFCDTAEARAQIALVSLGAWSVQAGSKHNLFLSIGDDPLEVIEGEIASAPGFGLEFYAVAADLSPSQLNGLRASNAFSVGQQDQALAALPLTGSSAAISRALSPPCG